MKKILGISLVAMMAVNAAHANIASEAYVTNITGALANLNDGITDDNLVAAINSVASSASGAYQTKISAGTDGNVVTYSGTEGQFGTPLTVTTTPTENSTNLITSGAVYTALAGKQDTIAANTYDTYGAAQAVADKMVTGTATSGENAIDQTATDKYPSMATAKAIADASAAALAGNYATAAQGTLADDAVRSVTEGSTNGTISVNTGGTTASVAVHGLGSAAYAATTDFDAAGAAAAVENKMVTVTSGEGYNKNSTTTYPSMATAAQIASEAASALAGDYATAAQGTLADDAVRSVTEGSTNGTISVNTGGTTASVAVHGLGSAAYTDTTAYLPSVASVGSDGTYVLTATVTGSGTELDPYVASGYKWELISRP